MAMVPLLNAKHAVAGVAVDEQLYRPLRMVKMSGMRQQESYVTLRVETIGNNPNAVYVVQGTHLEGVCTTSAEDAVELIMTAQLPHDGGFLKSYLPRVCLERARRHELRGSQLKEVENDKAALLQLLRGVMTSTFDFPLRA